MLQLEDFALHDQLNQQRNKGNTMANVAKIIGKVIKSANKKSSKTIAAETLKARQKIDTEAIAARSVRIKSKEVKPIVLKKRPTVMKTKPNPPNPAKIEYKFGMGNNRMIKKGVPLEARIAGGVGRKSRIQTNKLKKK